MAKKIIAIIGTYRKGGIIDQATDALLSSLPPGTEAAKVYLLDKHIEFCTNCRKCACDDIKKPRGKCMLNDDMESLLCEIDASDAIIFGSPVNFMSVTALAKRFIERLLVYAYWPWAQGVPKLRSKKRSKKAIIITSSACPKPIGMFMLPQTAALLKEVSAVMGAKVVKSLYFGSINMQEKQKLTSRQIKACQAAANKLL